MRVVLDDYITSITNVFDKAESGYICTPFYTKNGLGVFDKFRTSGTSIEFWTRLNILDWTSGFADLPALVGLLDDFSNRSKETAIYISNRLHAKVYMADRQSAYVGSANLTYGGLRDNVEILVELSDEETNDLVDWVSSMRVFLTRLDLNTLSDYVDISIDAVSNFPKAEVDLNAHESSDLNAAIELAEDLLISAIAKENGKTPDDYQLDKLMVSLPKLDDFVGFCSQLRTKDADAQEIIDRHNGKNNLQGHIKQSYYNVVLFLSLYPIAKSDILKWEAAQTIKLNNETWIQLFRDFMEGNANYINEDYKFSFRVLKNILPETVGGNTVGGGGGISSFRRVLRLTAMMLTE